MKEHDTENNCDDNYKIFDKETAEVVRIAEELKRAQEEEDEEENREWDGSETEFVEDDDAEEYEIPMAGIKLSYVLTAEEYFKCLKHSGMYKFQTLRVILLGALAVAFFVLYFTDGNISNMILGCLCLVFIAVMLIVPTVHMKSVAKGLADGRTIEAEIFPDIIEIGRDDGAWKIKLDGTSRILEFDNIIMIFADENRSFAIPERAIEPDYIPEIKAILFAGTKPSADECD